MPPRRGPSSCPFVSETTKSRSDRSLRATVSAPSVGLLGPLQAGRQTSVHIQLRNRISRNAPAVHHLAIASPMQCGRCEQPLPWESLCRYLGGPGCGKGGVQRRRRPDSLGQLGVHTSSGPNWAVSRRRCRASHAASCQMSAVGTDSTKATSASRNASSDWKSSSPDAQKRVTQTPFITSQNRG